MLDLFHLLHIAGATVFVGTVVFFDWAVGGALARMSTGDRKRVALAIRPFSGPLLMGSLALTLAAGVTRLFLSGVVQSFGDLLGGYSGRAMLALIIVVVSEGLAGPLRKRMRTALEDEDDPAFQKSWRAHRALNTVVLICVLLLMVSMRMGW